MQRRTRKRILAVSLAVLGAAGLIALGRLSTDLTGARKQQVDQTGAYIAGLRAGEAQGRQEGRALQAVTSLPAGSRKPSQDAFNAGYSAGANDVFAGYDGGWALGVPYVVTLERGAGPIVYRIGTRVPVTAGLSYYLCADGHDLCQQPRH